MNLPSFELNSSRSIENDAANDEDTESRDSREMSQKLFDSVPHILQLNIRSDAVQSKLLKTKLSAKPTYVESSLFISTAQTIAECVVLFLLSLATWTNWLHRNRIWNDNCCWMTRQAKHYTKRELVCCRMRFTPNVIGNTFCVERAGIDSKVWPMHEQRQHQ